MSNCATENFAAGCSAGMEKLVEEEILHFGGQDVEVSRGVVSWRGSLVSAYKACLWSRFSSRVLLEIKSFDVVDFDSLYDECRKINWREHLNSDTSLAVSCTVSEDAVLNHSHFASLRVKDAVVDQFVEEKLQRPNISKERPGVRINLYIKKNRGTISIDLSGESLHRRGYRDTTGIAPLKETLAAAIVTLSGWNSSVGPECSFLDPMCGSGTLLIEAALLYGNSAPGLSRSYFGFNKWLGNKGSLWSDLVEQAIKKEEEGLDSKWPSIIGYDSDPIMVSVARNNIKKAGLEDKIQVKCSEIAGLKRPTRKGFLVSNLPYGERLSAKEEVKFLYSGVGRILRENFSDWNTGLFISQPDLADTFKLPWQRSHKLYNGPIPCRLYTGPVISKGSEEFKWKALSTTSGDGVAFANRLRKNFKKLSTWSKSNRISCFRVYDRDLPEYNVVIDIYEKWVLVQEISPPSSVEKGVAENRFSHVLKQVRDVFNIKRDRVFIKRRQKQRGKKQYEKRDTSPKLYEVREGDCFFLVSFTNYLDTGIFLDHRPVRRKIGKLSSGKRFLNLFGYTGTATVHASLGGATLTTTVDLSANYLDWTRKNLALNGLSHQKNELIRADCVSWLQETESKYDLIFLDPPTFSNTKKKERVFDIQKDHLHLIELAMNRLATGGLLIFSTNSRKFRLDNWVEQKYVVKDISEETIPFDFQRSRKVHKCWEVQNRN